MIIRNFYDGKLAQASYLIGCAATGEAMVIDPSRASEHYVTMATSLGLKITAVTETHIHADFLSGARELASKLGATLYLSAEGGDDWQYEYRNEPNVKLVRDGETINIGRLRFEVLHTPGHTPEHIAFLLTDVPTSELPHSLFSGDFVFAGDVGRPDLLERAANIKGTMDAGARQLHRSLKRLKDLPDSLLIWPGHGAGSSCGKSLGGSPVSTLGYERHSNWAFLVTDEDRFVDEILMGQPEPPLYFKEMKRMNRQGPAPQAQEQTDRLTDPIGQIIDVRDPATIRVGSYADAVAVPHGAMFTGWAGWVANYEQPITLISTDESTAQSATNDLKAIGLDNVVGWVHPSDLDANRFQKITGVSPKGVLPTDLVLDVRASSERAISSVKGSTHIPFGVLAGRLEELPRNRRIVVHCASGKRSLIACSTLLKAGFEQVLELPDGMPDPNSGMPELVGQT